MQVVRVTVVIKGNTGSRSSSPLWQLCIVGGNMQNPFIIVAPLFVNGGIQLSTLDAQCS